VDLLKRMIPIVPFAASTPSLHACSLGKLTPSTPPSKTAVPWRVVLLWMASWPRAVGQVWQCGVGMKQRIF